MSATDFTIDNAPGWGYGLPEVFAFGEDALAAVANDGYSWARLDSQGKLIIELDGGKTFGVYTVDYDDNDNAVQAVLVPGRSSLPRTGDYSVRIGDAEPFLVGNLNDDAKQPFDPTKYAAPLPKCLHAWDAREDYDECTVCGERRDVDVDDPAGPEVDLLQEAISIITGSRAENYGKAENSFGMIADLWTTYLDNRTGDRDMITAHDVAMMMALLKIARQTYAPKRDNLVDLAGYAALAQRITETGR